MSGCICSVLGRNDSKVKSTISFMFAASIKHRRENLIRQFIPSTYTEWWDRRFI